MRREDLWMLQAKKMKEAELQAKVVELAEAFGWKWYHPADSRLVVPGFPDLTMVRAPQLIFAELKQQTRYPEPEQRAWHEQLAGCPDVLMVVWRPYDLLSGEIERTLRRIPNDDCLPFEAVRRG